MENTQKKKSGESSIASSIVAAFCIILYICALVQASVRLYMSIDQFKSVAEREFRDIAYIAVTTGRQGFMDQQFVDTMNNALAKSRTLEALIITGPDGEYAFEKQRGRAITWVNNYPRFINRLSFSNQSHYLPLSINDLRNTNIKGIANAFDYVEFSKILKDTLLLILIGFAVAFFTMLLQALLKSGSSEKPAGSFSAARTPSAPIYAPPPPSYSQPAYQQPSAPVTEYMDSGPKGLYSARSNIGWEDYTQDRLDSELHRCASTEKDLTLVCMEFASLTNDSWYQQAAEEAVTFFASRDLLFESGYVGITAILPGINLDTGISKAEIFYQRILEKFPGANLSIGLSSRAGRLIDAERLMFEGTQALAKARSDSRSAIIAFRSDPEKYRAYISQKG